MNNEKLYKYLTLKCKEKGLQIEHIPQMIEVSRSSLYRYMKGTIRMSSKVQSKFIKILQLDETEKREFERLVGLSEFDSTMIDARYVLDDFVFGKHTNQNKIDTVKFAYYERDVFLRTSDQIYELIESLSAQSESSCKIRIVNCLEDRIFKSVSFFIKSLFTQLKTENIAVEHLLMFSEKDYLHNTNVLINIIPLLRYKRYSVYCSNVSSSIDTKTLLDSMIIVELNHKEDKPNYFFISFLKEDLSACLSTSDKNVFAFQLSNYESFKKSYNAALLDSSTIDLFSMELAQRQEHSNCFLLKPNCCYDRIPILVYESLIARNTPEELERMKNGFAGGSGDTTDILDKLLYVLGKRFDSSYVNRHIDTYSMEGLADFAKSGRLTDHFDFMISFDKKERKTILEYMRDRNNDPNDDYTLNITKEPVLDNGYIILVFEDVGVMIEYNKEEYCEGTCTNLFINNKMLADVFSDFVKNHVPNNHALTTEEATTFLNTLIDSLN